MAIRRAISAVVPTAGQAEGLAAAVATLRSVLAAHSEEFEILLVDAAGGAVARLADDLAAGQKDLRAVHAPAGAGRGTALREGFLAARLPLVLRVDLDGRYDLGQIPLLVERVDQADIVTGYRSPRQDPWPPKLRSWLQGKMIGTAFGVRVRDCGCAFTLYRRKVFKHIPMASCGDFLGVEILAKANTLGYRIDEVAVAHLPPPAGPRPVRRSHLLTTLRDALRLLHSFDLQPDPSVRRPSPDEAEPGRTS